MNELYLTCQKPPVKKGPFFAGLLSLEVNNGVPDVPECRTWLGKYLDGFSCLNEIDGSVVKSGQLACPSYPCCETVELEAASMCGRTCCS